MKKSSNTYAQMYKEKISNPEISISSHNNNTNTSNTISNNNMKSKANNDIKGIKFDELSDWDNIVYETNKQNIINNNNNNINNNFNIIQANDVYNAAPKNNIDLIKNLKGSTDSFEGNLHNDYSVNTSTFTYKVGEMGNYDKIDLSGNDISGLSGNNNVNNKGKVFTMNTNMISQIKKKNYGEYDDNNNNYIIKEEEDEYKNYSKISNTGKDIGEGDELYQEKDSLNDDEITKDLMKQIEEENNLTKLQMKDLEQDFENNYNPYMQGNKGTIKNVKPKTPKQIKSNTANNNVQNKQTSQNVIAPLSQPNINSNNNVNNNYTYNNNSIASSSLCAQTGQFGQSLQATQTQCITQPINSNNIQQITPIIQGNNNTQLQQQIPLQTNWFNSNQPQEQQQHQPQFNQNNIPTNNMLPLSFQMNQATQITHITPIQQPYPYQMPIPLYQPQQPLYPMQNNNNMFTFNQNNLQPQLISPQIQQVQDIHKSPFPKAKKKPQYKPKTIKDYKEKYIENDKKQKHSGGLGPNIGTKEWEAKEEKKKKIQEYSKRIKEENTKKTNAHNSNHVINIDNSSKSKVIQEQLYDSLSDDDNEQMNGIVVNENLENEIKEKSNRSIQSAKGYGHINMIKQLKKENENKMYRKYKPVVVKQKTLPPIEENKKKLGRVYTTLKLGNVNTNTNKCRTRAQSGKLRVEANKQRPVSKIDVIKKKSKDDNDYDDELTRMFLMSKPNDYNGLQIVSKNNNYNNINEKEYNKQSSNTNSNNNNTNNLHSNFELETLLINHQKYSKQVSKIKEFLNHIK